MALADQVGPIPGTVGKFWNGIATTCNFATVYWCFCDEFNRQPTVQDVMNMGSSIFLIKKMIPDGVRQNRPGHGNLQLTRGSVLIFVNRGEPGHSCVATGANTIGGYNQVNWYIGGGAVDHGFSTHNTNSIDWGAGGNVNDVRGNQRQWCQLVAVPEAVAKSFVRQAIQG
jgi:hypothetical protein